MIVVRNLFRVKFGPSKSAVAAFKEGRRLLKNVQTSPEWRTWYETFIPYCESGSREIFTVVE